MRNATAILVIILIFLGIPALIEGLYIILQTIWMFVKEIFIPLIRLPKNQYDFFQLLIEENVVIFNIKFIDKALFFIASIIPSLIVFIYFFKTGKKLKLTAPVTFLIYLLTVLLFQCVLFWIIVLIMSIITVKNIVNDND